MISKHRIRLSEIHLLGTSYGGYIALLMAKFAPHTFNVVIDNSGFVMAQFSEIYPSVVRASGSYARNIDGIRYEVPVAASSIWENDELSYFYFSDANKMIRNLSVKEHMVNSETKYFIYHSVHDLVAPFPHKKRMCEQLQDFAHVDLMSVDRESIDGSLFKTVQHGMQASLRGLFDLSYEKSLGVGSAKAAETDFHRKSSHVFSCLDKRYHFDYDLELGVSVSVMGS